MPSDEIECHLRSYATLFGPVARYKILANGEVVGILVMPGSMSDGQLIIPGQLIVPGLDVEPLDIGEEAP